MNPEMTAVGAAVVIGGVGLFMLSRGDSGDGKKSAGDPGDSLLPADFFGIGNGGVSDALAAAYGYDVDPNVDPAHSAVCLDNSGIRDPNKSALEKGYKALTPVGWIWWIVDSVKRKQMCDEFKAKKREHDDAVNAAEAKNMVDAQAKLEALFNSRDYAAAYAYGAGQLKRPWVKTAEDELNALLGTDATEAAKMKKTLLYDTTDAAGAVVRFNATFDAVARLYYVTVVCVASLKARRDKYKQLCDAWPETDKFSAGDIDKMLQSFDAITAGMAQGAAAFEFGAIAFDDPDAAMLADVALMRSNITTRGTRSDSYAVVHPSADQLVISDLVHVASADYQTTSAKYVDKLGIEKMIAIAGETTRLRSLYWTFRRGGAAYAQWQRDKLNAMAVAQVVSDAVDAYVQLPLYIVSNPDDSAMRNALRHALR